MLSSIIAISGLGGHAFGSFKERGGEHMWLRDALPYDITGEDGDKPDVPISRIMIHGYESSLQDSDNFQNLEDIGTSFHSSLRSIAITGSFRPIILVAHSLGGLIVKEVCTLTVYVRLEAILTCGRPSYPSPNRMMRKTKSYYEQCTESHFSASHTTAWISSHLYLWLGTGRTAFYWSLSGIRAHRSSASTIVTFQKHWEAEESPRSFVSMKRLNLQLRRRCSIIKTIAIGLR